MTIVEKYITKVVIAMTVSGCREKYMDLGCTVKVQKTVLTLGFGARESTVARNILIPMTPSSNYDTFIHLTTLLLISYTSYQSPQVKIVLPAQLALPEIGNYLYRFSLNVVVVCL